MDSNLLVKDMIKAIDNKELKIVDLCNQFGFSDRTIQKKIRKLGFDWDAKEGKYNFTGTDRSVFDLAIVEVFKNNIRDNSNSAVKREVKKEVQTASKEIASTIQTPIKETVKPESKSTPETTSKNNSNNKSDNTIKRNVKKDTKKDSDKDSDNIDLLLAGKKAKKQYRGFYLDSDVLSIIDSVSGGVKSELVNECLRKVFKDKGLL